tara:strand:- start:17239 stop:17346 length:108 start_codon:yes stop_codon:yes gene_type:complete
MDASPGEYLTICEIAGEDTEETEQVPNVYQAKLDS